MKKVVASLVEGDKYEVASNAARAPYFIVFDNDKFIKSIKNPFVSGGWAWFAVAELLKDEWCELFIAWKIGENMKGQLEKYGIKYEEK